MVCAQDLLRVSVTLMHLQHWSVHCVPCVCSNTPLRTPPATCAKTNQRKRRVRLVHPCSIVKPEQHAMYGVTHTVGQDTNCMIQDQHDDPARVSDIGQELQDHSGMHVFHCKWSTPRLACNACLLINQVHPHDSRPLALQVHDKLTCHCRKWQQCGACPIWHT